MDNTLVSARVPKAKKERAALILESQGATMSDLINEAIDRLIETGSLPHTKKPEPVAKKAAFDQFLAKSTLDISWPESTPADYRELEQEWRRHDYESLA